MRGRLARGCALMATAESPTRLHDAFRRVKAGHAQLKFLYTFKNATIFCHHSLFAHRPRHHYAWPGFVPYAK